MGLYLSISIAFLCFIVFFILSSVFYYYLRRNYCYSKEAKQIQGKYNIENNANCYFLWNKNWILFLCILGIMGCIYVQVLNKNYEEKYADISGKINVKAVIISEPEDKEYKYTYQIKVQEINGENKYKNTQLILDVKKKDLQEKILQYGDEIILIGEFKPPNSARNYKGFDYKEYLKSKKIYGTITLENHEIIDSNTLDIFSNMLHSAQKSIKQNMQKVLNEEEAALCVGILVGDRGDISEQTEENFRNSNLTHMLAVSGSHITYIINAMAILLSRTSKKVGKVLTILFLLFFMALTGFTSSVIRACIMGILVLTASIIHRKSDTINNLGISAFIILLFNPFAITDVGFLLSYGGTIGIVVLGDKITNGIYKVLSKITKYKLIKYIINSFSITLSANIILIPIMAYKFSTISITFWISNILAAPIMEIATIFGFVVYFISIVFLPFAQFLGIALNFLLTILLKIAEVSSLIPGSCFYIKTPFIIECIIYYLIIILILNWRKLRDRWKERIKENTFLSILQRYKKIILYFCIAILLLSNILIITLPKTLKINFIDVGQGDCTLITTPTNKHILIDGGGSEFGSFDVGESILLPYLLDRRITTIDYVLISHFDSDHIGGLFSILENLKVENVIITKQGEVSENLTKFQEIVRNKKINVILVNKGDIVPIDNYSYFEILFPEDNLIKDNILNNNSMVASFHSLGLKILFTGDIEEVAEKRLYELYQNTDKLDTDILKVAHHGSKTSSTAQFLELVTPRIVFIGVGEDNKFGHPNIGVLDRISSYTKRIYRTDINGEIEFVYRNGKVKINTMY